MQRVFRFAGLALLILPLCAAVSIGRPAPGFAAAASNGHTYRLAGYHGKFVVLEWHNNGCPYTRKHYESGNMQRLQAKWTARGVVWFTVISSAKGEQGYVDAAAENAYLVRMKAAPTAALLDPSGRLGHLYDAKTTPQMIVIGPSGTILYDGAMDNRPTSDPADIPGAENYVDQALTQAFAGKPVSEPATRPYGCSVKYAN